jgi:hypothetical protein
MPITKAVDSAVTQRESGFPAMPCLSVKLFSCILVSLTNSLYVYLLMIY